MDYAFILCFEHDVESKFQSIIHSIANNGISSHMLDAKIPPHISIAAFKADHVDPIIREVDKQLANWGAGNVVWPSLGMFSHSVLFAAPVLNEYLLNACITINRLIEPHSTVGERGMYLPYHWLPHTTLAVRLNRDALRRAIDLTLDQFSIIRGKTNRLMLIQSEPYAEVKTWEFA